MLGGIINSTIRRPSTELYIDKALSNFGLGQGLLFGGEENSNNNIAIGKNALNSTSNQGNFNIGIGTDALTTCLTGDENIAIGYNAGNLVTTGSQNTFLGYEADADANSDSYHVRIGHYGGVKFFTGRFTLDNSYVGTPAAGHAAHSNALFTIPAYSHINRVYATVVTAGAGTHNFTIEYHTTLDVASGSAVSGTEILGASDGTGCTTRSQATQNADSDIAGGGTAGVTWVSYIDAATTNSDGWVDGSDVGIYIVHAGSNDATDPGTDPIIQLTVEYTGV